MLLYSEHQPPRLPGSNLKVSELWWGGVVDPLLRQVPTLVVVELGCDNFKWCSNCCRTRTDCGSSQVFTTSGEFTKWRRPIECINEISPWCRSNSQLPYKYFLKLDVFSADMYYFSNSYSKYQGAGGLRSRWDFLAVKSTILGQFRSNFRFRVQMDALEGLWILVRIGDQEGCLPRIQWVPLDDSLETLIILTFFRAFRELIPG